MKRMSIVWKYIVRIRHKKTADKSCYVVIRTNISMINMAVRHLMYVVL